MAVTADQVDIRYNVDYSQYLAQTLKVESAFAKSMANMSKEAVKFGHASAVAFDPITESFTQISKGAGGVQNSLRNLGNTMNTNRLQVGNLAAQFNDIGVTLAGGMSPFLIALQQGTQINQVLGQLEGGVMPALKQAFMSLLTPTSLLTIGVIALGGYGVQAFMDMISAGETLEDVLENHRDAIDRIITGYENASKAVESYRERAERLDPELAQIRAEGQQEELRGRLDETVAAMQRLAQAAANMSRQEIEADRATREAAAAVAVLRDELAKSEPNWQEVMKTLERVSRMDTTAAFASIADEMKRMAEDAFALTGEINATAAAMEYVNSLEYIFENMGNIVDGIKTENSQKEVQDLVDQFRAGEISLADLIAKLGELSVTVPDLQPAVEEIARLGIAADITRQKIDQLKNAPQGGTETVADGKTGRLHSVDLPDWVGDRPSRRVDPYFDGPTPRRSGGGSRRSSGPKLDEYQRATKSIQERVAALQAETAAQETLNPLVDDYGYAVERAKVAQQLLTAAKEAGMVVGKELTDVQRLLAGELDGLTPKAREQAEAILAMAEASANATQAAAQLAESQQNLKSAYEDFSNFGQSVMSSFIKDLRDGKDATDALASALTKVSDKLIDMAVQGLFDGLFGGGGKTGARGGLLGGILIPGILHDGGVAGVDGYGHGRAFRSSTWAGAQRYHGGGIAGLAPGEVPAILRRGETVIPEGKTVGGSVTAPISIQIDARGADPAAIQRLNESVEKLKAEIPGRVVENVRRANKQNVKLW